MQRAAVMRKEATRQRKAAAISSQKDRRDINTAAGAEAWKAGRANEIEGVHINNRASAAQGLGDTAPSSTSQLAGQDVDLDWRELHIRRRWEKLRIGGWRREAQVAEEEAKLAVEDAATSTGTTPTSSDTTAGEVELTSTSGGMTAVGTRKWIRGGQEANNGKSNDPMLSTSPLGPSAPTDPITPKVKGSKRSPPAVLRGPSPSDLSLPAPRPAWLLGLVEAVVERHLRLLPTRPLVVVANSLSKLDLELEPRQV